MARYLIPNFHGSEIHNRRDQRFIFRLSVLTTRSSLKKNRTSGTQGTPSVYEQENCRRHQSSRGQTTVNKSTIMNALSINSNVICMMQIMLAVLAYTFSNALKNTNTLLLENTCETPTIRRTKIFGNSLLFLRNVGGILNA